MYSQCHIPDSDLRVRERKIKIVCEIESSLSVHHFIIYLYPRNVRYLGQVWEEFPRERTLVNHSYWISSTFQGMSTWSSPRDLEILISFNLLYKALAVQWVDHLQENTTGIETQRASKTRRRQLLCSQFPCISTVNSQKVQF